MKLKAINPPLLPGQQIQCSICHRMSSNISADTDAKPFTFVCFDCAKRIEKEDKS